MVKKYIGVLVCVLMSFLGLTACVFGAETVQSDEGGKKLSVVTTIFPEYDWVREIIGENDYADVTMLLDNGVDLHSYQATAEDIVKLGSCDLFIYVGGESDEWVEDALKEAVNKDMAVIDLLDVLGDAVKEEEIVEGMEAEEDEAEEEPEYDEHVWLSLRNAQVLCQAIADALSGLDPDHDDVYQANAAEYKDKLAALDGEYAAAVQEGAQDTLLFGDRFPFRYLADDYGLNYYAAFAGCSAESEASFETVLFLANKIDELGLNTVLTIESSDGKIAETVISAASERKPQIMTLDSMQSTTMEDVENGASYLSVMQSNLDVLREALK